MIKALDRTTILFEDNHLLVVNKPAGLLTQPAPDDSRPSLEEQAKAYLKEAYNKPGRVFLHAVHRIDRLVSGLVLFARTDKALTRLNLAMRKRRITKVYHALVEGQLSGPRGRKDRTIRLIHYLHHSSHRAIVSDQPGGGGRESILDYTVLQEDNDLSLVEIQLITGRYHQIRAQFAHIGHPITGDRKYGAAMSFAPRDAIALHSHRVRFPHPVRNEELELVAPYPSFFTSSLTPGHRSC